MNGLTPAEVSESRQRNGNNVITPPPREPVWRLLLEKFNDPIIRVLLAAAFISLGIAFVEGGFTETIGIFCAIFLATGVAFAFEYNARRRFDLLNRVNDDIPVRVRRGGEVVEIPKRDVVVGDIVLIESGEEIPADGELLEAVSLQVDESTLTGESLITKTTDPARFSSEATYPSNHAMRGTTALEGRGVMVTLAVGDVTEFGKVARQATIESSEQTPLNRQLARLSSLIGRVGTALALLIFVILVAKGFLQGDFSEGWLTTFGRLLRYFMVSVAILVMAIPEGLPMSITLSLALSMRRMLKTNNLVRKMHACETMGAVTVICTDKTGTLTQNRMQVAEMACYNGTNERHLFEAIGVNSTAFLDPCGKVIGNPTEGALLLWMRDRGEAYAARRAEARVADQMTFTTERKYMATLVEAENTEGKFRRKLYVKGAPEIVRGFCAPDGADSEIEAQLAGFQGRGMRTLGFACMESDAATCAEAIEKGGLRFMAVAAISDPVREDVPEAVGDCLGAGIHVKIVTGDTPVTAREIARQIGLWGEGDDDSALMTGAEFAGATDGELLERIPHLKILARARPLDKLRLVRLLQQQGEVVAVTGDGTNDAPALNFAHVGVSMGSGTSVAREASDITLLDDSFASIATAVMWGRSLYKNIGRFVLFQLTVNVSALLVVFLGSIFGHDMPLTVIQILWINLIMDTFAAMALASLPPSRSVMRERPRRSDEFIITSSMRRLILGTGTVFATVLLALLFIWGDRSGEIRNQTLFFTLFVMMQFWNLFNAKSFNSPFGPLSGFRDCRWFLAILLIIILGQWMLVTFGGEMFRTAPLTLNEWAWVAGVSALTLLFGFISHRAMVAKKSIYLKLR